MKIQYKSKELIIFESALYRTTSSLIIGENYILLVDPNWLPIEIDFIEKEIELIGVGKEKFLLFTHSDYDHIIGYGRFKKYKVIASLNFVNNDAKEDVLNQIIKFDDEYYVERDYEIVYPKVDISIGGEGQKLQIGNDEYQFFQAKGHNKDGLITFNITKQILIAGDYLSNIEFPYIYDSYENYLNTLSKFENLINQNPIQALISGHGDYTSDKIEMKIRIRESRKYIIELVNSIKSKENFDEKVLFEKYKFPIIMKQFHQKNILLIEKELKSK
jgi:glyoxylase-like metal-dependent hydrolase (beta-lactamase superfamily II)